MGVKDKIGKQRRKSENAEPFRPEWPHGCQPGSPPSPSAALGRWPVRERRATRHGREPDVTRRHPARHDQRHADRTSRILATRMT